MSEPIRELRTYVRGNHQIMELSDPEGIDAPEYRAHVQAAGRVNNQDIQVQRVVQLQATTVQDALDEIERDIDMHAQHALRGAIEQMSKPKPRILLPGEGAPLNGRMRLQK